MSYYPDAVIRGLTVGEITDESGTYDIYTDECFLFWRGGVFLTKVKGKEGIILFSIFPPIFFFQMYWYMPTINSS